MEENFCVLADESSHHTIAENLIKVRKELTFCAVNDFDLPSGSKTIYQLQAFNQANRGTVSQLNQAAREARQKELAEGGDSSGFEDVSEDDEDNNDSSSDDKDDQGAAA